MQGLLTQLRWTDERQENDPVDVLGVPPAQAYCQMTAGRSTWPKVLDPAEVMAADTTEITDLVAAFETRNPLPRLQPHNVVKVHHLDHSGRK